MRTVLCVIAYDVIEKIGSLAGITMVIGDLCAFGLVATWVSAWADEKPYSVPSWIVVYAVTSVVMTFVWAWTLSIRDRLRALQAQDGE